MTEVGQDQGVSCVRVLQRDFWSARKLSCSLRDGLWFPLASFNIAKFIPSDRFIGSRDAGEVLVFHLLLLASRRWRLFDLFYSRYCCDMDLEWFKLRTLSSVIMRTSHLMITFVFVWEYSSEGRSGSPIDALLTCIQPAAH